MYGKYPGLTILTPPSGEPVSLAEMKEWLLVDQSDHSRDGVIRRLIRAAREFVETETQQQLVSLQLRLTLEEFWCGDLLLPVTPLQGVSSITYYDANNAQQTLATTVYSVDTARHPGRVRLTWGQSWPSVYDRGDAVQVNFWAGHGPVTETTTGFEAGAQTITPATMNGIYAGSRLLVGEGEAQERIVVSSVTSTTFTATFARGHPDPCPILPGLPERARQALEMHVNHRFEHRGDIGGPAAESTEKAIQRLLNGCWAGGYA